MSTVGQLERITQNRVVTLFREQLGYHYLGNWGDRPNNSNVEEEHLRSFLQRQGYSAVLISRAIYEFKKTAGGLTRSLYDPNKAVYSQLRYGVQVKADVGENNQTVWLIDWQHPLENDFAIAEEVTIKGENTKRPDIVLYVNGIALGVLELKRSTVPISEGIRQNLDNQNSVFIRPFFTTLQLVMAGNDTQGLRYGTIETREKYYLTWKEDSQIENMLDRALTQLCDKQRLLEIVHDFVVFDAGIKKLCRPNQYFGVHAVQEAVRRREGGILWHTQGSGKSLTMVWLAKWIRENIRDARVVIITDRTELDEQIEQVFKGVNETITRTRSGQDLIAQLNTTTPWLLCSLIHKFTGKEEGDVSGFLAELQRVGDFKPKGDIYVFVDECHRTQSGALHEAMKKLLPNALFLGFTGTPLLKAEKQKSIEVFGPYIHTYKFNEAVEDKVILDLRYEARDIEQSITSPQRIDQWFEAKTRGLNDVALAQLKKKWGTMQKVLSSQSRLSKIVADILLDMETQDRLDSGRGNAMLVSGDIYRACRFYELFLSQGFDKCAIITSYRPNSSDIKGEESGEGLTEKLQQYEIYKRMLGGKDPETFEQEVKKQFVEAPGQMRLLIVVDKLLTGFDAPPATYLYIDKKMQNHGLFQAICRVNRLDGEDKEYGYIVDYQDLFQSLERSIADYTSGPLAEYDAADVAGLLSNRVGKARERLEQARESICALCEPVAPPRGTQNYIRYFCGDTTDKNALVESEPKRIALYRLTVSLLRAYANIANDMPEAGYSAQEIEAVKREVDYYEKVRTEVKAASGDYIDLKMYEPAMRHLIDTYIRAEDSTKISAFEETTLVKLLVERGSNALQALPQGLTSDKEATAETIENNLRRVIINERSTNPVYYEKMSELLDTLIQERQSSAQDYEQYLAQVIELAHKIQNTTGSTTYPHSLNTSGKRVLYDNLSSNEQQALDVNTAVQGIKKDGWRNNKVKEREVLYAIHEVLLDESLTNTILEIVKQQDEY